MKKPHLSLLALLLMLLFSACARTSSEPIINESLPVISSVKTLSDRASIALEWQPLYNEAISGFYVYRGTQNEPLERIATIKNKFQTHFVDEKLAPATQYHYSLRTFNSLGHISLEGASVSARTAPRPAPLPFIQVIENLPHKIKLIWRPHPDTSVSAYIIERAQGAEFEFKELARVENRLSAEFIDEDLAPGQDFTYRIFAQTYDGVLSESSQIIRGHTRALPPEISNLQASSDLLNQVRLSWQGPEFSDFAYYQVYASSSRFLPFELIAKTKDNFYTDSLDTGSSKQYKVSVVDKTGLESVLSEAVTGQSLGAPKAPRLLSATPNAEGIELVWQSDDIRVVKYLLKRYGGSGDALFKDISDTRLVDITANSNQRYEYEVIGIDENGLESSPSNKISVIKP